MPALKTSFKNLSLSYQPLLKRKRSSLLAQLPEGTMAPGRAAASSGQQWGLCGCLSLQGAAWPFPLCAAARAGLKGVRFALSPLCFLQTFWWLVEQREKEPLLRTGSAEVPGLYRSGRRMFLLHTQSGLALLGLNVELLS